VHEISSEIFAVVIGSVMTDHDEVQLSKLAKRMLAMPSKKRDESKIGKPKVKAEIKANSHAPRATAGKRALSA